MSASEGKADVFRFNFGSLRFNVRFSPKRTLLPQPNFNFQGPLSAKSGHSRWAKNGDYYSLRLFEVTLSRPTGDGRGGGGPSSMWPTWTPSTAAPSPRGWPPKRPPRDAEWGERYFHITDPDGHELSFARPVGAAKAES